MDEARTITGVLCVGLYYYGARYLDAKYSRWLSADPAMSDYMSGSFAGGGIYNSVNFNLYHYAGNNPIKYTDPTGQWIKNEDGSYTAKDGDTLLGLSQLTGRDWRDTDYSGRPEDLQVNQTVRFRTEFDLKFEGLKIFLNATVDICAVGSQLLKSMANNGYTAAVATSIPLKLMDDPFLLRDAETLKYYGEKIGKAALFAAFAFDLYDGIKTGIKTNSFWRGLIKPLLELYLLVWDILLLEQRHFL